MIAQTTEGRDILWVCLIENKGKNIRIILRYAAAKVNLYNAEIAYRIYVTDCLKLITENTALAVKGNYPTKRFIDILEGLRNPMPELSAEEIIEKTVKGAGLVVVE